MGSNTTAGDTNTSLTRKGGKLLPHSGQAAACPSSTKPEIGFLNVDCTTNPEEVAKVMTAVVGAFLADPFISGDVVQMNMARGAKMAEKLGVDEEVWEQIFKQIATSRRAWHERTGFSEFMG